MICISKDYSDSVIKNNFYNEDCRCFKPESICYDISLYIKSALLVSNYPLVPYHVELFNTVPLTSKQVWDLHCKLVDSFNEMVDLYKEVDTDGCYGYM